MKKNKWFGLVMAAGICAAGLTNASADITTTTTFGTIQGNPNGGQPYSGTGIPFNASEITTISGIPVIALGPQLAVAPPNDTVTLALSATAHGASNPSPGNNGAGTFSVNT